MNRKAGEKRKALYKIRRWVMRLPMADLPPLRPPMTDGQLTVLARLREAYGPLEGCHIAIDGKTLRGTSAHDAQTGGSLMHLVRAWVDERSLSAGQVLCEQMSNEIEAIPRLLVSLKLRGATVTINAMGTQVDIAGQIHEAGEDYVLSLKANQKNALAAVTQALEAAQPSEQITHHEALELSHGRCEKRQYQLLDNLEGFAKSWKWAGLQAVGKVRREVRRNHEGPLLVEEHYFLCSFKETSSASRDW